jgi:hypothetical protein
MDTDLNKYGITTTDRRVFVTPDGREHKTAEKAIESVICDEIHKVFYADWRGERDISVWQVAHLIQKHWPALVEVMSRGRAMKE